MSFMELLAKIVDAVIKFFEYKSTKNVEEKNKKLQDKKIEKQLNKDIKETTNAIYSNDDDKLNQILAKCVLVMFCLCLYGCITKTIYVSQDRQIKSITYQGVDGKFVPNKVMEELVTDALKWRSYEKESRK